VTWPGGQEFHVLQLVSASSEEAERGDAGTVPRSEAVQSYRKRLLELREELEEAEQFSDAGRTERAKGEIEFLTNELLACAVGLGKGKKLGSDASATQPRGTDDGAEADARCDSSHRRGAARARKSPRADRTNGDVLRYFPVGRPRARRR